LTTPDAAEPGCELRTDFQFKSEDRALAAHGVLRPCSMSTLGDPEIERA